MNQLHSRFFLFAFFMQISFAYSLSGERLFRFEEYRSIDGSNNNPQEETWGAANTFLRRRFPSRYGDKISTPAGQNRASARVVSNIMCDQRKSVPSRRGLTDLVWIWGQFVDHDIDLSGEANPAESFPIFIPKGDRHMDPDGKGNVKMPFKRTVHKISRSSKRQQINQITSFLDGSVVYGSNDKRAKGLRTLDGTGKLKTSKGNLLPFNNGKFPVAGPPNKYNFLAGDVRANENIALITMQTIFVREHNRLVDYLTKLYPRKSGEEYYQMARALVGGMIQAITFREWLPALIGPYPFSPYGGYQIKTNPAIFNLFSTAAFRFGHSMLSKDIIIAEKGKVTRFPLRKAFFAPELIVKNGIDGISAGMHRQKSQENDLFIVDDVRNFLFANVMNSKVGLDLAAMNIQRGRDHGLPSYVEMREKMGSAKVRNFYQITKNYMLAKALKETYGSIENIDAWVGLLAEVKMKNSSVSRSLYLLLRRQFENLRDGDRFWYQNYFNPKLIDWIERQSLRRIILRNTKTRYLPKNIFID